MGWKNHLSSNSGLSVVIKECEPRVRVVPSLFLLEPTYTRVMHVDIRRRSICGRLPDLRQDRLFILSEGPSDPVDTGKPPSGHGGSTGEGSRDMMSMGPSIRER